jgi:hypothetical protein
MRRKKLTWALGRGAAVGLLGAAAATGVACNLFLDLKWSQCDNDSDCAAFGQAYTCVSSTCVVPDASDSTSDGGIESGGIESGGAACQSNAQCNTQNAGKSTFCDKNPDSGTHGKCVQINYTNDAGEAICILPPYPKLYGTTANPNQLLDDNDLLIGAFAPIGGNAPLVGPAQYTYELAQEELHAAGGIPGGTGNPPKPLSIIYCDSDPAKVEQGVRHLVYTLHVPAILAAFSDTTTTNFVQKYMVPNGVFTLNPQYTPYALKNSDVKGLLWNLLGSPDELAPAFVGLVSRVEKYARGRKGDAGSAPVRVVVVTSASDCATEFAIYSALSDPDTGLRFNGQNLTANVSAGQAKIVQTDCADTNAVTPGTYTSAEAQIAAFQPDIVVALTAQETGYLVQGVEDALYAEAGTTTLPIWVLSTRNDQNSGVLAYLGKVSNGEAATQKLKRFLGVQFVDPSDTSQVAAWMMRMQTQFPGVDPSTYAGRGNFYDAIYWLTYGYASAGPGAPVTGESFKTGVRKLVSGPNIYPGDTLHIGQAFTGISNNPTGTTFYGTLAQPNFPNPASGIPLSYGSVYCYSQPNGTSVVATYDELVMDPDAGALVWNPDVTPCFSF